MARTPQDRLDAAREMRMQGDIAYESWKRREAWLDFVFAVGKATGVIWLAKRIPFLRLRPWVQDREDGLIPPPE